MICLSVEVCRRVHRNTAGAIGLYFDEPARLPFRKRRKISVEFTNYWSSQCEFYLPFLIW